MVHFIPDAYTYIVLVYVGTDAGILRHRNIRISTNASKKLQRRYQRFRYHGASNGRLRRIPVW